MATWLAVAVLAVTITALVVTSIVSLTTGDDLADDLSDGQLSGRATLHADQLTSYLESIRSQTLELATGPELRDAAERFSGAYSELTDSPGEIDAAVRNVAFAYRDVFVPEIEASVGVPVAWQDLVPVSDSAIYLQDQYVVVEDLESDELRLVADADDGSAWSAVHAELHPRYFEITERLGLQDLIITNAEGVVVYSTAKALDFATSLDIGPHSGTALASLVRRIRENPEEGAVTAEDFSSYAAQRGLPVAFFASPITDGGRLVGILAVEYSATAIDSIMTAEEGVENTALGASGENYVVARDGRMRSTSRFFLENPETYLVDAAAAGTTTEDERAAMAGTGTTVTWQLVAAGDDIDPLFVDSGDSSARTNYLGAEVVSAVRPIDFEGLDWSVVSEVTTVEFEQPIADFRRAIVIAVTIFVILVSFATVIWAGRMFQPLRNLSERLRRVHEGEDSDGVEPPESGPREFAELSGSIEAMITSLDQREAAVQLATEERLNTVRSLLPPAIAERVEAGDRRVLDQIPQATIAVLAIGGLGNAGNGLSAETHRAMLERVLEELDALADHHGLERVKVVGGSYFAGCGLTQTYLDHAPRAVAFALDARSALVEMSAEAPVDVELSGGIHVGPVTSGLAGSARLVYDLWGDTVSTAHQLARMASPSVILISDEVKSRLPSDVAIEPSADAHEGAIWQVVGHAVTVEQSP